MICPYCKKKMKKKTDIMEEDNIKFESYKCGSCGRELMDMKQLHNLANKYRKLKNAKDVTFTKWGNSLAVRISKSFVKELGIHEGDRGLMFKDGKELRIIHG